MKKLASIICMTGLILGLVACAANDPEAVLSENTETTVTSTAEETEKMPETEQTTTTAASSVVAITEETVTTKETTLEETDTSEDNQTAEDSETEQHTEDYSPGWVQSLPEARDKSVKQMIIVAAEGMNSSDAYVSMHERDADGNWVRIFSTTGYVGASGMIYDEDRYEGCMRTPIGTYRFTMAFGIEPDPGCAISYTELTDDLYWSGDYYEHYNRMVSINDYPDLDTSNSEHLIDYDPAYRYCLNIGFNEKGTAGRGSAIFLHCFGYNSYTAGCVAVSEDTMVEILQRVEPDCVIVIDTVSSLGAG